MQANPIPNPDPHPNPSPHPNPNPNPSPNPSPTPTPSPSLCSLLRQRLYAYHQQRPTAPTDAVPLPWIMRSVGSAMEVALGCLTLTLTLSLTLILSLSAALQRCSPRLTLPLTLTLTLTLSLTRPPTHQVLVAASSVSPLRFHLQPAVHGYPSRLQAWWVKVRVRVRDRGTHRACKRRGAVRPLTLTPNSDPSPRPLTLTSYPDP